jgi:hypothetical protein
MIERVVLIKLSDAYANDDERGRIARHARRVLPLVPGVKGVTVGVPADESCEQSWDLSIIVEFADGTDIPRYLAHPDHRAFVDQLLKPRMEVIKAWNFAVADPVDETA